VIAFVIAAGYQHSEPDPVEQTLRTTTAHHLSDDRGNSRISGGMLFNIVFSVIL
jgi:hypothetical protein